MQLPHKVTLSGEGGQVKEVETLVMTMLLGSSRTGSNIYVSSNSSLWKHHATYFQV